MVVPQKLKAVILDCDGVLFDVNREKSLAFAETVKSYPKKIVDVFVKEHQATGGVSRYEKFARFFNDLCPSDNPKKDIELALKTYADIVQKAYRKKKPVLDAEYFVKALFGRIPIFVASGSDQEELRAVFEYHRFHQYFVEIFGSPVKKIDNVNKIISEHELAADDVLFIGDGGGDYQTTLALGLPFIYLGEMAEWRPSPDDLQRHPQMWIKETWKDVLEDFNVQ
jgi:phosphoglycolate phosphatase-like HAD superfamily hydrolase